MSQIDDTNDFNKQRRNFIVITTVLFIAWFINLDPAYIDLPFVKNSSPHHTSKILTVLWCLWGYFGYRFSILLMERNPSIKKIFSKIITINLYREYEAQENRVRDDTYDSYGRYDLKKIKVIKGNWLNSYDKNFTYFNVHVNNIYVGNDLKVKNTRLWLIYTKSICGVFLSNEFVEFFIPIIWAGITIGACLPK